MSCQLSWLQEAHLAAQLVFILMPLNTPCLAHFMGKTQAYGTCLPDIEVGLHALLHVGELKAGHLDDVEESLANHP